MYHQSTGRFCNGQEARWHSRRTSAREQARPQGPYHRDDTSQQRQDRQKAAPQQSGRHRNRRRAVRHSLAQEQEALGATR